MRVLLTGGSGFIAAHILERLLKNGHSVIVTVRSESKAEFIRKAHSSVPKNQLGFAIVEDIAQEGAFDKAVVSDPPFEAVLHTASPFTFNVTDVQKQLIDPAVIGTTGILKSIKKYAPSVTRVVITSSFVAIIDTTKGARPGHTYSEKDWCPVTHEQALENSNLGYRASKTFAEKAAWEFLEKEKPNFTIATLNPPLVYGPIVNYLNSLDSLNTSNQRVRDIMQGKMKETIGETGTYIWADVRDLALAHVRAMELPEAANTRFFFAEGYYCNNDIIDIIRKNLPEYADQLPPPGTPGGAMPEGGIYEIDNSKIQDILGIKFNSFEQTITDLAKSLEPLMMKA